MPILFPLLLLAGCNTCGFEPFDYGNYSDARLTLPSGYSMGVKSNRIYLRKKLHEKED